MDKFDVSGSTLDKRLPDNLGNCLLLFFSLRPTTKQTNGEKTKCYQIAFAHTRCEKDVERSQLLSAAHWQPFGNQAKIFQVGSVRNLTSVSVAQTTAQRCSEFSGVGPARPPSAGGV